MTVSEECHIAEIVQQCDLVQVRNLVSLDLALLTYYGSSQMLGI